MISPHVQHYLSEHLRGLLSSDDAREVLRLIDDSGALVTEFDNVFSAVAQKIPGLAIDFDKLLSGDEIEGDPLISQGNLALLRLDAIYYQAFEAWKKSGGDLHRFRRITKAENPATYSDSTEKHERTDENYPPDAQLLNQVVNITLSGFRIQATITHRRDQLKLAKQTGQPIGATQRPTSQPDASARDSASAEPRPETNSDIINENEIFDIESDLKPFPKIGRIQRIQPLDGINPLIETPNNGWRSEINLRTAPAEAPGSSAPPHATHPDTTNTVSQNSREEEPVISEFSAPSASPHETTFSISTHYQNLFAKAPPFHKRE